MKPRHVQGVVANSAWLVVVAVLLAGCSGDAPAGGSNTSPADVQPMPCPNSQDSSASTSASGGNPPAGAYGIEMAIEETGTVRSAAPGRTATFNVTVRNPGTRSETVDFSCGASPPGWSTACDCDDPSTKGWAVVLPAGGTDSIQVEVTVAADAEAGDRGIVLMFGTVREDSMQVSQVMMRATVA